MRYSIEWLRQSMADNWNRRTHDAGGRDDTRLLDWLEQHGHCADWDGYMKRVIHAADGTEYCADTWREAIHAAIAQREGS